MTLISEINLGGVVFNDVKFNCPVRLGDYERVLGPPARSESPGPPAPSGHRNNVIHFYDHLGLLLREHHSSCLIDGIEILLEPSRWFFPTTSPYLSVLQVCGVNVDRSTLFENFAQQCTVKFRPHLGHAWYVDAEAVSIQLETYKKGESRSAKNEFITLVAVGFAGEPDRRPLMTFSEFSKV
jgi:hypothetical protein